MVLFMVIIASFAMVFPSGYHLNLKTYRQNQAVDLADAILQEIISKPFSVGPGDLNTGDSLENLRSWTSAGGDCGTAPGCWAPHALAQFVANNPAIEAQYHYTLPRASSNQPGIQVVFLNGGAPTLAGYNPLAQITVNLAWTDNSQGVLVPRLITVRGFATYDR